MIYREAWCAAVHGVTTSWTWLSDWTELISTTDRSAVPGLSRFCLWPGASPSLEIFPSIQCQAMFFFFAPLLSSLPFPFSPLLLCPPLFYLASKLLIILIGDQFYLHFSVLDASGASLSNAHQGEYPPNRKTSLSLWRGCLLTQLLRKRRYSLHYYICYSIQLLCGISFYEWNKLLSTFSWTISLCYLIFSDKNMRTLYCWI